jgi:dihydropteroate synthase
VRLIEALGVLEEPAATIAVAAGLALPLAGGKRAFTLAGLIEPGHPPAVVAVRDVPAPFRPALDTVTAARPRWAGLDPARPAVMGILNVTPDSFSDGGRHKDVASAIAAGRAMVGEGADIIDVGGESTRPGSAPTDPEVERARVLPVIEALASDGMLISIDTRNAATMSAALAAGATIVNDVSGLRHDPDAAGVVADAGCPVIIMHMRGTPETMAGLATYENPVIEIASELADTVTAAEQAGIDHARIAIDPGIGFAKQPRHSAAILAHLVIFLSFGYPIVIGVSRKSFIGRLSGVEHHADRLPGSLSAALASVASGASIVRVHDVAETVQALRVRSAIFG